MFPKPIKFKQGYYRMPDGKLIQQPSDSNYYGFIWDFFSNVHNMKPEVLATATYLPNFKPTPAELWEICEGAYRKPFPQVANSPKPNPKQERLFKGVTRIRCYLNKLVEFGYLAVNQRGYYGGARARSRGCKTWQQELVERIVGEMAYSLGYHLVPGESYRPAHPELLLAWANDPTKEKFLALEPQGSVCGATDCHITGLHLQWYFDGQTFSPQKVWDDQASDYIVVKPFQGVKGKLPRASYTIDVLSGKLALFQWIEDPKLVQDLDWGERPDINSQAGRIEYARYFEKLNFWHLYVGGRGRTLYKKGEVYRIGHQFEDEPKELKLWPKGWKEIGAISFETDLRWLTACDASKLKPKHCKADEVLVIDVPPGKYTLTDCCENDGYDTVFAHFEKAKLGSA
jgi:rRNA maturation protein Nop10